MSSESSAEEVAHLSDSTKQAVIAEYLNEQKDRRSMEQALHEAEIALMAHNDRFQFASARLLRRKANLMRDLQRALEQYRRTLLSCPLSYHEVCESVILTEFPFLVIPRATLDNVLLQVRQSVDAAMATKYGQHHVIHEVSEEWYRRARQYLGLSRGTVPHPDVISCIVPQ